VNYILDACALIAFINKELGDTVIKGLLDRAKTGEITVHMSIVNLVEVFYGYIRDLGKADADDILQTIYALPINIIDIIADPVFQEASRLKGTHKMSTADAFGLATAVNLSGVFVTSDHHELEAVEAIEHITFLWLPPRPRKS
jgi:predicted nucleic acid-binding protein